MFKKILLLVFIMIDIFDLIHYLIGLVILALILWILIKIHNYFSKDNQIIEPLINRNKPTK
jgi:hypothetical protein